MCPITLTINSQKMGCSNEQTRWEFAVNLPRRRPRPPPCCRGWRPLPSCDDPQCTVRLAKSNPAPPRPRARQPADHQRHDTTPNQSSTIIIGTSLVRGLGSKFNSLGTKSITFTYPGRDIPYLRSRLQNNISQKNRPERIIIQCGGYKQVAINHFTHEYEGICRYAIAH